jgi:nitroreductase
VDLRDVVRRRRMVRSFDGRPIPPDVLDGVLDLARRIPSAGFTQGLDLLVLDSAEAVATYWSITFPDDEARAGFAFPGLFRAPVLVLPLVSKQAYLDRYSEPDKAATGLGGDESAWPVAYWDVDAGMSVMLLLLAAVDAGLGALFFGIFRGEDEVLATFAVPSNRRPAGVIALGYPDGQDTEGRSSASRGRRPFEDVVHRNTW